MVPLDGDDRNTLCLQLLQALDGMDKRHGIDGAFMKEVAGNDQKIYLSIEGIINDIPEGPAEIIETLAHPVLFIAEMGIRDMDERGFHSCSPPVLKEPFQAIAIRLVWPRDKGTQGCRHQYQRNDTEQENIPPGFLAAGGIGDGYRHSQSDDAPIDKMQVKESHACTGMLSEQ